jgi:hypothetical protein
MFKSISGLFKRTCEFFRSKAPASTSLSEPPPFSRGSGTSDDPFQISSEGEFAWIADFPDCHFVLKRSLLLHTPVPRISDFKGKLDGGGHEIEGIRATSFWIENNTGEITDLTIVGSEIASHAEEVLTALIGINRGSITRVELKEASHHSSHRSTGSFVAGLVAANLGMIEDCKVSGTIQGLWSKVGGIAAHNYASGRIFDCKVRAAVLTFIGSTHGEAVGGICAVNEGVIQFGGVVGTIRISNSRSGRANVGGVVGLNEVIGSVLNPYGACLFEVTPLSLKNVGGIVGHNRGFVGAAKWAAEVDCGESDTVGQIIGFQAVTGSLAGGFLEGELWKEVTKRSANRHLIDEIMIGDNRGDTRFKRRPGDSGEGGGDA